MYFRCGIVDLVVLCFGLWVMVVVSVCSRCCRVISLLRVVCILWKFWVLLVCMLRESRLIISFSFILRWMLDWKLYRLVKFDLV